MQIQKLFFRKKHSNTINQIYEILHILSIACIKYLNRTLSEVELNNRDIDILVRMFLSEQESMEEMNREMSRIRR